MKTRFLICMAVVMFLFMEQLTAQDVNRVLQNREKRQVLYAGILNNDAMFLEFMESAKIAGRAKDGIDALTDGAQEKSLTQGDHVISELEFQVSENQLMIRQMARIMKEFAAKNPEFQKEMDTHYPEISEAIHMDY